MIRRFAATVICCLLLTGCEGASLAALQGNAVATWEWLRTTLSGATLSGAVSEGRQLLDDARTVKDDTVERVEKIGEGIDKLQEGKDLIEEGVGRE